MIYTGKAIVLPFLWGQLALAMENELNPKLGYRQRTGLQYVHDVRTTYSGEFPLVKVDHIENLETGQPLVFFDNAMTIAYVNDAFDKDMREQFGLDVTTLLQLLKMTDIPESQFNNIKRYVVESVTLGLSEGELHVTI